MDENTPKEELILPEKRFVVPDETPDFIKIAGELKASGLDTTQAMIQASKKLRDQLLGG